MSTYDKGKSKERFRSISSMAFVVLGLISLATALYGPDPLKMVSLVTGSVSLIGSWVAADSRTSGPEPAGSPFDLEDVMTSQPSVTDHRAHPNNTLSLGRAPSPSRRRRLPEQWGPQDQIDRDSSGLGERQDSGLSTAISLPWKSSEREVAEPDMDPHEPGRVLSNQRPHGSELSSGTVLRNGMELWVDTHATKELRLGKEQRFHTHRVIIRETREVADLWVGDVSFLNSRHSRSRVGRTLGHQTTSLVRRLMAEESLQPSFD
ncbi:hypothetical protein DL93DRAFT_2169681 [Clavulina sp. PMI_390]|nr:hypothetical protein DL93DRAFT_2169681 [Clavulina sp. PMI_390]